MPGNTPTLLELTSTPTGTTLATLLDLLRRDYDIALARRSKRKPDVGQLNGSISLGKKRLTFEANTHPDPQDESREYLTIDLDSLAYEAAYDLLRERVHPRAKQALVNFCIEIAAALKVEGFRLRFLDYDDEGPLTAEKLVKAMTSTDKCGLAGGFSLTSTASSKVQSYWFKAAKEIAGYLVVVAI